MLMYLIISAVFYMLAGLLVSVVLMDIVDDVNGGYITTCILFWPVLLLVTGICYLITIVKELIGRINKND